MRNFFYAILVSSLVAGAIMDCGERNYKSATIALLFAAANAVIFFWR